MDLDPVDVHSPDPFLEDDDDETETKFESKYDNAQEVDLSAAQDSLFLTRVPKFTWQALSAMKDDDEIQVGTLRVQGDRQNPAKVSLMLDPNNPAFRLVPREYNLRVMNKSSSSASSNTFVFTEQDFSGFKGKVDSQPARPGAVKKEGGFRGRNFRMPGYKRAVPKKTALVGHVKTEFNCLPVESPEYVSILSRRHAEMPKTELAPKMMEGNAISEVNPGGVGGSSSFNRYIGTGPQREKKQQQKSARIPKNELLDKLFQAFRLYKYWYIKDLRQETKQPEQYLREVLEEIAETVRQGPHANTWRLKDGIGNISLADFQDAEDTVAPETAGASFDGLDDDDGDENVKMEDVHSTADLRP